MKASKVNLSKVSLSTPKKGAGAGFQMVYVNYDGAMSPLFVQSPKVDVKWDSNYYADNDSNGGKYTVEFALPGVGSNDSITDFHDKMAEFDTFVIDNAFKNRTSWFKGGTKLSRDTIETLYTPMVKLSKDS